MAVYCNEYDYYISGLQTVPEDVYEAGSLDGATGWKKFKLLTFPLIIPFFTINMVLCVKLPHGIRPDHGTDKRRTCTEYRVHLLPDLQ